MRAPGNLPEDRSAASELEQDPTLPQLVFVPADPPRASWFAQWTLAGISRPTDVLDLVRPNEAGEIDRRRTPVQKIDLVDAIELLGRPLGPEPAPAAGSNGDHDTASDDADEGPLADSVRAWAAVVLTALRRLADGQLRPGLTESGTDTWRLTPLTGAEVAYFDQLVAAMPASGHCIDPPDSDTGGLVVPYEIMSARHSIELAMDAIVDRFLRTNGALIEAGHRGFAVLEPTTIDSRTALMRLEAVSGDRPPLVALRLAPPEHPDGLFDAEVVFVSRRNAELIVPAKALWGAPDEVRQRFRNAENVLLLTLRRAARIWAPLQPLLDQPLPTSIELSELDLDDLAGPIANDLGATGLSILWPADLVSGIDLKPVVGASADASVIPATGRTARLDLASLLELRWEGMVNGQLLTADELKELAEAKRSVIRLRGQWVRVDDGQLKQLTERRRVGATTALAVALGGSASIDGVEHEIEVEGPLASLGDRLRNHDPQRRLEPPENLHVDLRPYQERGLAWLVEMDELGLGGVLADDMGLGKTVQILGLHVQRQESRPSPTLVICPTSVVGNWEREANRFAPDTPVIRYHGTARSLDDLKPGSILLTSYGVARRDAAKLAEVNWGLVVADEAQNIKNPSSRTARALRTIGAETRFALTGTPVQNQLADLWAILDWTTPGLLGPLERFRRDLANPIERDGDPETAASLNRLLRPFLLRRRKSDPDIAPDLPPKTETDEIVPLTSEQATLYQAVVSQVMAEIAAATGIERRGLVLRLLTRLKQVCNHPVHLLGEADDQDGKLEGRSGKLTAATDLLEVIVQEGEAALVFTQYVTMGHLLQQHFTKQGHRTLFLHGGLSVNSREKMVEDFQAGEADVFVVSLKAGGTGLNLTAATHVIHYDRWWNPAVEDQASDRAWRIGQDRPVQIHRMICEGTIEDRISVLLREKRALADAVVGAGEGWISELTDNELAELVALSDVDPGDVNLGDGGSDV